ncbi:MAG: hypothetical protein LBC37_05885 [Zoogloeaceae bacterium]|jgi:type II secretory pathway component PulM|nr:hypothetical protein [Zoogloeaceae bacterium]
MSGRTAFWKLPIVFWQRCSSAERGQIVAAACFLLALLFWLFVWKPGEKQLGELIYRGQKLAQRQKATQGAETQKPRLDTFVNIEQEKKNLEAVTASLAALKVEQQALTARLVSLEDLESLQRLKSELTRLAEEGDMEVVALEHRYCHADDRDRPPTLELLRQAANCNPYRRPLLTLKARASYRGLMQFLDGLRDLSNFAAPVWSAIHVGGGGKPANRIVARQWLEVEIHLAF